MAGAEMPAVVLLAVSLTKANARSGKRVGWVHDVCQMGSLAANSSRTCYKWDDGGLIIFSASQIIPFYI